MNNGTSFIEREWKNAQFFFKNSPSSDWSRLMIRRFSFPFPAYNQENPVIASELVQWNYDTWVVLSTWWGINRPIHFHNSFIMFYFWMSRSGKRRRFKPWENLRRIFQRKSTRSDSSEPGNQTQFETQEGQNSKQSGGAFGLAATRSRSTSELLATEPQAIPV